MRGFFLLSRRGRGVRPWRGTDNNDFLDCFGLGDRCKFAAALLFLLAVEQVASFAMVAPYCQWLIVLCGLRDSFAGNWTVKRSLGLPTTLVLGRTRQQLQVGLVLRQNANVALNDSSAP
jgi:hypothetical protein